MLHLKLTAALVSAIGIGACARTSVMPIAADTVQIRSRAALACGPEGAQKVAFRQAAVETIRRGYDRFLIIDAASSTSRSVVGTTPVVASSTGSATATSFGNQVYATGQSRTVFQGGDPIVMGSHNQGLMVRMFKDGDPSGANALSARAELGPDGAGAVESTQAKCL